MSDTRTMARIPMTAAAQLEAARKLGHELYLESAPSRADFADQDGGQRYRMRCTCGWSSNWRGSQRALGPKMALHLGSVIAEELADPQGVSSQDKSRRAL